MRTTKSQTERTRSDIIAAARDIFAKKGYEATNMQDIADSLQITRTPLYYHFTNKKKLFEAVVEDYLEQKEKIFLSVYTSDVNIFHKAYRHLMSSAKYASLEKVLFMGVDNNAGLSEVNLMRQRAQEFMYNTKIEVAKEAIKKGELKPGTDPYEFIHHTYVIYLGFISLTQYLEEKISPENFTKLADTLFQGMLYKYQALPFSTIEPPERNLAAE